MSSNNERRESRDKITFNVDGQRFSTRDDDQEAASILRLAGKDPDDFDLVRVRRNGDRKTFEDSHVVELENGDEFVTVTPSFRIIVNGQEKTATSRMVSYTEVTGLAFPDKIGNSNITFVVLYRRAKHPKEGSLVDNRTVEIRKDGTIFNVTFTNRS